MATEIRPLSIEDLEAISGLVAQLAKQAHCGTESTRPQLEAILEDMETQPHTYFNLVAVVDSRVVGFLSLLYYKSFFHRVGTAQINELVVDRAHRNAGIGEVLIAAAKSEARRRGMDEIEVSTESDNTGALRFYRSNGFTEEYILLGMELGL